MPAAPGAMKWVPKTDKPAEGGEESSSADAKKNGAARAGAVVAVEGKSGGRFESEGEGKSNGKGKGSRGAGAKKGQGGKDPEPFKPQQQQQQKGGKGGKGDRGWNDGKGDASGGKGDKGGGKASGKGGKGGKDMGKGGKKGGKMDFGMPAAGVKTMHEVEAEISKTQVSRTQQPRRPKGPTAYTKQPIDAKGAHCEVHKHSGMGCAVVSMESFSAREAIITYVESKYGGSKDTPPKVEIGGVIVQMRRHTDKTTQREVITDLFVAWGHKQEKEAPLACDDIADFCDKMFEEAQHAPATAQVAAQQPQHPLAVAPQQMLGMGGRPLQQQQLQHPGVPPPPTQVPNVGTPQQQMVAQGVPGQAYYHDYQRAAAYNQWMNSYGMHQYYQPQHQHAYQQQQQQQAATAAMHQQQMRQMQMQQQMQQQQMQQQMQPQQLQPAMQQQQQQMQPPQMPPQQVPEAPAAAPAGPVPSSPKPRMLPIVDPSTGKSIDTMGMNFEPRKPSSPLKIIDPTSGENVAPQ